MHRPNYSHDEDDLRLIKMIKRQTVDQIVSRRSSATREAARLNLPIIEIEEWVRAFITGGENAL